MEARPVRILIFEDRGASFQKLYANIVSHVGSDKVAVKWCKDDTEILNIDGTTDRDLSSVDLKEGNADIIVVDLKMPSSADKYGAYGGIAILEKIFSLKNYCRSVIVTSEYINIIKSECPEGFGVLDQLKRSEKLTVISKLLGDEKQFSLLRQIISTRLNRRILEPRIERQILFLARTDDPILVLGNAGCGKEGIVKAIHTAWCDYRHEGDQRPYYAINAGALQYDLMRSELFGYAENAFTGAVKGSVGIAFKACGIRNYSEIKDQTQLDDNRRFYGTLFIDEIGTLDLRCQGLLLRFLEEPFAAAPVGSPEIHNVRPRIIAATNSKTWMEFAERGSSQHDVRSDLFERVARHIIWIPDLLPSDVHGIIRTVSARKWDATAIEYVENLVDKRQIRGNIRGLINFVRRAELIVDKGEEVGWDFQMITKDVVDLALSLSLPAQSQGAALASGLGMTYGAFVTPRGNSATVPKAQSALDYALRCEDAKHFAKELPGRLISKHGETGTELLLLAWFAIYSPKRKPPKTGLDKFKHDGATKWFHSESTKNAHRALEKTAKSVFGLKSVSQVYAAADLFYEWCKHKDIWPNRLGDQKYQPRTTPT